MPIIWTIPLLTRSWSLPTCRKIFLLFYILPLVFICYRYFKSLKQISKLAFEYKSSIYRDRTTVMDWAACYVRYPARDEVHWQKKSGLAGIDRPAEIETPMACPFISMAIQCCGSGSVSGSGTFIQFRSGSGLIVPDPYPRPDSTFLKFVETWILFVNLFLKMDKFCLLLPHTYGTVISPGKPHVHFEFANYQFGQAWDPEWHGK